MLNKALLAEFKHEAANTRKLLERIPESSFSWKPHEKSMSMIELAQHISNLPFLMTAALTSAELDLSATFPKQEPVKSTDELLKFFDEKLANAVAALEQASDEMLKADWTLRNGEMIFFKMPRIAAIRSIVISHIIHHRGQLTVYLRLQNVPLPFIYGPTADEGQIIRP